MLTTRMGAASDSAAELLFGQLTPQKSNCLRHHPEGLESA